MDTEKSLSIFGLEDQQVPNTFFQQKRETAHLAIIFPGLRYNCSMPLLYYTTELLIRTRFDVLQVEYDYSQRKDFLTMGSKERTRVISADALAAYRTAIEQRVNEKLLLVGKSLGTLAMGHLLSQDVRKQAVRCIWLTPLFSSDHLRQQIRVSKPHSLFVAGTGDRHHIPDRFDEAVNVTKGKRLVLSGADHSLEFPNDVERSIVALGETIEAIRSFLAEW